MVDFPEVTIDYLRTVPCLEDLSDEQLHFLLEKGEIRQLKKGDIPVNVGDEVNHAMIILEGEVAPMVQVGGQWINFPHYSRGGITGMLPYSRMRRANGRVEAYRDSQVLMLHKSLFPELEQRLPSLTQRFVETMIDRIRESTRREQQYERSLALNKLSAGFAHELNNPAAAISRSADSLSVINRELREATTQLVQTGIQQDALDVIESLIKDKDAASGEQMGLLDRSAREDELLDWLEARGIRQMEEFAETLVNVGFTPDDLEDLCAEMPETSLLPVLRYISLTLQVCSCLREIQEAGKRVTGLVNKMKDFTHMDKAPQKENTFVQETINHALGILGRRIQEKNVRLITCYEDQPALPLYVREINQAWMQLIDNALDALPDDGGVIEIHARITGQFLEVNLEDNGTGFLPEHKTKIFEPFFTTKKVGEGTGLGLDIARRIVQMHDGTIEADRLDGKTRFSIYLPLNTTNGTQTT